MRSYSKFGVFALLICLFFILLSGCTQKPVDDTMSSKDSAATSDSSDSVSSDETGSLSSSLNDPGYIPPSLPGIDDIYPPYEGNESLYETYPIVTMRYGDTEVEVREDRAKAVELARMIYVDNARQEAYRAPEADWIVYTVQDGEGTQHTCLVWPEDGSTLVAVGEIPGLSKDSDGGLGYNAIYVFERTDLFETLLAAMD